MKNLPKTIWATHPRAPWFQVYASDGTKRNMVTGFNLQTGAYWTIDPEVRTGSGFLSSRHDPDGSYAIDESTGRRYP